MVADVAVGEGVEITGDRPPSHYVIYSGSQNKVPVWFP